MTAYVVDSMGLLRYLVDRLPDRADDIFDRAERGLDVVYAPDVVIGETLYQVAIGDEIGGVALHGDPSRVYRRTVTRGPVEMATLDEDAMGVYASLVEFYQAEWHDAMVHAAHQTLDSEAVISDDPHLAENGVDLLWE